MLQGRNVVNEILLIGQWQNTPIRRKIKLRMGVSL